MNHSDAVAQDPAALATLVTRLASLTGRPPDPVLLAEAVIETHVARDDGTAAWGEAIVAVCARLGLRGTAVRAPLWRLVATVGAGQPLLVLGVGEDSHALLLTDSLGARVRVEKIPGSEPRWQSRQALVSALGLSGRDGMLDAISLELESPLGLEEEPAAHAHEHSAHAPHVWRWLALERADVATLVVYALFAGLLSLVIPVTVQALVTTVTFGTMTQPLIVLTILVLGALAFAATLRGMSAWVVEVLQRRTFARVSAAFAERLVRADREALAHGGGPALASRFFDVFVFQKSIASLLVDGLDVVLTAAVGMLVLGFYHPILLALDVLLVLAVVLVVIGLGRRGPSTALAESHAKYEMAALLSELAAGEPARALGVGPRLALAEAESRARAWLFARGEHFRVVLAQTAAVLALQAVASAALMGVGGYLVIQRQLTLGQLVAAELIVTTVVGALAKMGKHLETYYDAVASLDKLAHALAIPRESTGAMAPPEGALSIALEAVPVGNRRALGLEVAAGDKRAVPVSDTDTRTHLAELLTTLACPAAGSVRLGGMDRRDLDLSAIRARITLVRDEDRMDGSLLDVVRAGRATSVPAVLEALTRVGLDVAAWPDSLRTSLGAGGHALDRAERARVLVARALVSGADLVVVDGVLDRLEPRLAEKLVDELASQSATLIVITTGASTVADLLPVDAIQRGDA